MTRVGAIASLGTAAQSKGHVRAREVCTRTRARRSIGAVPTKLRQDCGDDLEAGNEQ